MFIKISAIDLVSDANGRSDVIINLSLLFGVAKTMNQGIPVIALDTGVHFRVIPFLLADVRDDYFDFIMDKLSPESKPLISTRIK